MSPTMCTGRPSCAPSAPSTWRFSSTVQRSTAASLGASAARESWMVPRRRSTSWASLCKHARASATKAQSVLAHAPACWAHAASEGSQPRVSVQGGRCYKQAVPAEDCRFDPPGFTSSVESTSMFIPPGVKLLELGLMFPGSFSPGEGRQAGRACAPAELALLAGLLGEGGGEAVQVALGGGQQQRVLRALGRHPLQHALHLLRMRECRRALLNSPFD